MDLVIWNELSPAQRKDVLARPRRRSDAKLRGAVARIAEEVRRKGWRALTDHSLRLDGRAPEVIEVGPVAAKARRSVSPEAISALELAAANIKAFHQATRPTDTSAEVLPGLMVAKRWRPIERVGLYVPGGDPSLFSTLMMLAIPAGVAGVRDLIVATPPRAGGGLDPMLALAAELCGIGSIWAVGGPQAIAAMAFGAGAIEPVMKIAGPGNAYVSEAKSYVAGLPGGPAIDLPAGPSELMVIADEGAEAATVAADLLGQAEHDPNAQVMLVTTSPALAGQVDDELGRQLIVLPRAAIARKALKGGKIILAPSLPSAVEIANLYAPEHLSLNVRDASQLVGQVTNAGAVFAGRHAAETFGDYLAGSSHVLPTDGAARSWSGVSVASFMKSISVQEVSEAAASALAPAAAILARMEGLEAHARAAEARLSAGRKKAA